MPRFQFIPTLNRRVNNLHWHSRRVLFSKVNTAFISSFTRMYFDRQGEFPWQQRVQRGGECHVHLSKANYLLPAVLQFGCQVSEQAVSRPNAVSSIKFFTFQPDTSLVQPILTAKLGKELQLCEAHRRELSPMCPS